MTFSQPIDPGAVHLVSCWTRPVAYRYQQIMQEQRVAHTQLLREELPSSLYASEGLNLSPGPGVSSATREDLSHERNHRGSDPYFF